MAELAPLADFPAVYLRQKTMADFGIRIEFDLPETESQTLKEIHESRGRYLRIVVYDEEDFQKAMKNQK